MTNTIVKKIAVMLITLAIVSCEKKTPQPVAFGQLTYNQQLDSIKKYTSRDSVLSNDYGFIFDSLYKGKVRIDMSRYEKEARENKCRPVRKSKATLHEFHEGVHNLGDIDGDKKNDSVFVLNPLNICEEAEEYGQSYYFTNGMPRIVSESYCCHPNSIVNVGDIDQDGYCELAQYYSSCTSRFKHFIIWSLKDKTWKQSGDFTFSLNDDYEEFKDFPKLFKKSAKYKLECLEVYDVDADNKVLKRWKTVTIQ